VELESSAWNRLLTPPQKARAMMLQPDEKMIQPKKVDERGCSIPGMGNAEFEADFSTGSSSK
jgi:hypothetical protein